MAITKLALNGKEYNIGMEGPQMYEGRDLASYSWDDIKNMSSDGDYTDVRVGDFKELALKTGETVIMEIAGIDTHLNTGWTEVHGDYNTTDLNPVPHHIDWISRDCLKDTYQWNTTNTNNAVGSITGQDDGTDVPWLTSQIKKNLDSLYENAIPDEVKPAIINKINIIERRGTKESQTLTESSGWHWYPMGNLWLPSEVEVFGTNIWSQQGYGSTQSVQYPLFANSWKHRIKGLGNGGGRYTWWLCSAISGYATACCYVSYTGGASGNDASNRIGVPVCFRTAAATKIGA